MSNSGSNSGSNPGSNLEEIEVTIHPDGSVNVAVRGMHGPLCTESTKRLEALLGGEVVARELTDEYYRQGLDQGDKARLGPTK